MQVAIIGANFGNKGAQSMLFTTIALLRQNFPQVKIVFAHMEKACLQDKFLFEEVYYKNLLFKVPMKSSNITPFSKIMWGSYEETFQVMKNSDLIIDISGFALGNKWGVNASRAYLNKIRFMRALGVPIILMPQSFGPFDFGDDQKELDEKITDALSYPVKIFAREHDGYRPLHDKYKLKNVFWHPDIVLSSPQINPAYIYKIVPKISAPKALDASCVAVVPNLRSFDYSDNPWQTLQIYYEIINFLLKMDKVVYLFRHSVEDITPCKWLKSLFANNNRVILWENNFSCLEYDVACKQFDFLIIGRFHGIVHAYRNNVPCILMGWAVKYQELADLMNQSQYIFDITDPNVNVRAIFSAINDMNNNLALNKNILRENLKQVQQNFSCFDEVIEILNKIAGGE